MNHGRKKEDIEDKGEPGPSAHRKRRSTNFSCVRGLRHHQHALPATKKAVISGANGISEIADRENQIPENMQFGEKVSWGEKSLNFRMEEWSRDKKAIWETICAKYGGESAAFDWGAWAYFAWATSRNWLSLMSITKARKFGWQRLNDSFETWPKSIRAFENAGILRSQGRWAASREKPPSS